MQGWIVAGAWLLAVLLAAVVLGFAVYELAWKLRRLRDDQSRLEGVITELGGAAEDLQVAAERARRLAADRSAS